jgi:DNA polymerase-3 subunit epsilon/ribonuclease T
MTTTKYLLVDTETGGLEPHLSLLTATFLCLDENRTIVDKLELFIRPDDDVYKVQAIALKVNGINLVEHNKEAISESEAKEIFLAFVQKHTSKDKKLKFISQSTAYDLKWLQAKFLPIDEWETYFDRRPIDTQSTAVFLQDAGILPQTLSCGLQSLCEYFCIEVKDVHTATGDCMMTLALYLRLLELVKP